MTSADLLLHPIRFRIIQSFLGDRTLSSADLQTELFDVPPASLYRHVAKLVDAGVLKVVTERRVRGVRERIYSLRLAATQIGPKEIRNMTPDDQRQAFLAFLAGVFTDFDRYMSRPEVDPVRDGAGYRVAAMWLSESEYMEFLRDISEVVRTALEKQEMPERKRRILTTILLPGADNLKPHG